MQSTVLVTRDCPIVLWRQQHMRIYNTEKFIQAVKIKHNKFYSYDLVEYVHSKEKVCITCQIHGNFWQIPNMHLLG